jgi:hypothetical protein
LHIDAYHNKTNNRKEKKKKKQRIKIPKTKIQELQENSNGKQLIYLKEKQKKKNVYIASTQRTHAKFENLKKISQIKTEEKCNS